MSINVVVFYFISNARVSFASNGPNIMSHFGRIPCLNNFFEYNCSCGVGFTNFTNDSGFLCGFEISVQKIWMNQNRKRDME